MRKDKHILVYIEVGLKKNITITNAEKSGYFAMTEFKDIVLLFDHHVWYSHLNCSFDSSGKLSATAICTREGDFNADARPEYYFTMFVFSDSPRKQFLIFFSLAIVA